MSRKPAERPEQEQLSLTLPAKKEAAPPAAPQLETRPNAPATASPSPLPPPPAPAAPAQPRIYLVSELLKAARVTLESRFADVRVEGEISGLKRSGNGHIYFTLKDAEAQLDCVMYAREAGRLG